MSLKIDCGDREFTINIVFGMKYRSATKTAKERKERQLLMTKAMEIMPALEKQVLTTLSDHIGYDSAKIENKIHEREEKNAADRAAEDQGRAAKSAKRAGLPEPPKGKIGAPVKPGESPFESEDHTAE